MRNFLMFGMIALLSNVALANITSNQTFLLDKQMGPAAASAGLGNLVNRTRNLLVAKYTFAALGGQSVTDIKLVTDLNDKKSYATLPDNAVITNAWTEVITAPTSAVGVGKVAIDSEGAGDLIAAANNNGSTWNVGYHQGIPTGATTTFIKLTADRTIEADITVQPLTGGAFDVFIEYVIGE